MSVTANGSKVFLAFDEDLDPGARPQADAFTLKVDTSVHRVVGVDVYGSTVTLDLEGPVAAGERMTLDYIVPAARALQDLGGTRVEGFTGVAVANQTPVPVPTLVGARVDTTDELVLVYSRVLDSRSTPSGGDFKVNTVAGETVAVSNATVDGTRLILTPAAPLSDREAISVSYTPGISPIQDLNGTRAVAVSNYRVTGTSTPSTALAWLQVTELDQVTARAVYPEFHPETHHYALRCGDNDAFTLWLSRQTASTSLTVDGRSFSGVNSRHHMTGLSDDSDIIITLSDGGQSSTYVVHCIVEHFPFLSITDRGGASDTLFAFSVGVPNAEGRRVYFYTVVDRNGVPLFHRENTTRMSRFKPHVDGAHPYSFMERSRRISRPPGYNPNQNLFWTYETVILDSEFNEVDRASTTADIAHTDGHDFVIKKNGDYVLLSYETAYRDLSAVAKPDDTYWGNNIPVDDSIIQVVTPGDEGMNDGQSKLLWNSFDYMEIDDCKQHRFPYDYAHVNNIQILDNGNIVASFRGCSPVYLINGKTGEVIWKVGRSNSTSEEWRKNLLEIVGDPYGEFCGQHGASLLENGNLLLFDNNTACQVDAMTYISKRPDAHFSRAVEYSIDTVNKKAVFVRDHTYRSGYDTWTNSAGHVAPMPNGHWLISWGSQRNLDNDIATAPPPGDSITEYDPDTDREVFSMRITGAGELVNVNAFSLSPNAIGYQTNDTTAPRVTRATLGNGILRLTFDEDLGETSIPAASDFVVTVNGNPTPVATKPVVSGRTVKLALDRVPKANDRVTVGYQGTALRDTAANPNPVAPFSPLTAVNTAGAFIDIVDHTFASEIIWLADQGVTRGCGPITYCPDQSVTRAQMATFLSRAFNLPPADIDYFDDDTGSTHQDPINRLARTGISQGCGPRTYCPDQPVTRAQMAAFLSRAFNLPPADIDYFDDDTGSTHQDPINRLARTGISQGCGPRTYCPDQPVTRAHMAAFLHRAKDLIHTVEQHQQ